MDVMMLDAGRWLGLRDTDDEAVLGVPGRVDALFGLLESSFNVHLACGFVCFT
jgi:hypothetical protein